MPSDVLEYVRSKEPAFEKVDDDTLTQYVADRHPEFLSKSESFAKSYQDIVSTKPGGSLAPSLPRSPEPAEPSVSERLARIKSRSPVEKLTPLTSAVSAKPEAPQMPQFESPIELPPVQPGEKSLYEEETFLDKPTIRLGDSMFPEGKALNPRLGRVAPRGPVSGTVDSEQGPVQAGVSEAMREAVNSLTTPRNLLYMGATIGVGASGTAGKVLASAFWTAFMGKSAIEEAPVIATELGQEMAKPEADRDKKKIAKLLTQAGLTTAMTVAPAVHFGGEMGLGDRPASLETLRKELNLLKAQPIAVSPDLARLAPAVNQVTQEVLNAPPKEQTPVLEPAKAVETSPAEALPVVEPTPSEKGPTDAGKISAPVEMAGSEPPGSAAQMAEGKSGEVQSPAGTPAEAPASETPAEQGALTASPSTVRIVEHPSVPVDFIESSQKFRDPVIVEKYRQQIRNNEPMEPIDVIVDQETGKFSITNGHHKLEAAKLEGLEYVPVKESVHPYERQYENKEGLRHVDRPGHAAGLERREGAKLGHTPGTSAAEKIGDRPYSMAARPVRGDQPKAGQPYTIDQFPSAEDYGRWVQRGRPVSPSGEPILDEPKPDSLRPGGPGDAAETETKAEAQAEPPTVSESVQPKAEVAKAVDKVDKQVKEVAKTEGQRPAKEVKSELISRIEKAIEDAPHHVAPEGAKTVTIDIPGDGTFTIENTKENLTELLSRAKGIPTTKGTAPRPNVSKSKPSDAETIDRLIQAYGSASDAAKRMRSQSQAVGEDYTAEQKANAGRFANDLENRARLAKKPENQVGNKFTELDKLRRDYESASTDIEYSQSKIDEITPQELKKDKYARAEVKRYKENIDLKTQMRDKSLKAIQTMGEDVEPKAEDAATPKPPEPKSEPEQPSPEEPSKYRIGNNPQTYSLVEKLSQSDLEKETGEQPVKVRNDKTGKEETVLESDLTTVRERTEEERQASKSMSAGELDDELRRLGMDPSVFPDAKSKREALKRKKALDEGPKRTLGFGGSETIESGEAPAQTPEALKALTRKMTPGLEAGRNIREGIQSLLLPSSVSKEHLAAAENLGSKLGSMNRRAESAAHQLNKHSKVFDRLGVHEEGLPPSDNPGIQFMSDVSQGRGVTGAFKPVFDLVQKLFKERTEKLEEVGAPVQTVRENYFPGMWTQESRLAFNAAMEHAVNEGVIKSGFDVNEATPTQKAWVKERVDQFLENGTQSEKDMLSYLTRKPMKGKESFRKQKVFDDIMSGAEFGLRPISNNPIDLVKLKLAEMDKSIMANEFFKDPQTDVQIISPYEEVGPDRVKINDKYGTIYGPPTINLSEYVDKNVYDGLMKVAGGLGITPERVFSAGRGRLGYASTTGETVSQFATELSVLAHEIGHQLDFRYDLWDKIAKGERPNARTQTAKELRALADLSFEGSTPSEYYKSKVRKKEEKMAHLLEAYIHAPEKFKEVAPSVFKDFDQFIRSTPEIKGLADIKQGLALEHLTSEKYVGLPILGYRTVPKATGDIINNYLSSSLYNNRYFGTLYKGWMGVANALNQTQLGVGSAFHAGFTTGEVAISAGANVLKDIYGVLRANRSLSDLKSAAQKWSTAMVKTSVTGDRVLNAWRNPDAVIDPKIAQVVKATELAGGGYKMEQGLSTEQGVKMYRDWFSGNKLRSAVRSPVALTELMAKPIMEWLVPRQKAGVFSDLAWRIIEQHPGKSLEELTPQFRQAWNRVDSRLGQVRYNRLFTDNVAKNVVQALVRAPGWTGGTIAEIGGAFPDSLKFLKEWKDTGRLPENIPDRVAYTISLLLSAGAANAILNYAFTGQAPHGLDYFAFRTGRKDKLGNDERFLLPTYMKDLLAYSKRPGTTIGHKLHPLFSMINDVLKNKDYYGYEIRNPHGSTLEQSGQVGKYVIKSFEPFWTRGLRKAHESGGQAPEMVAPYFGVMPAPAYISRTAMQNKIAELYRLRTGDRVKPHGTENSAKRNASNKSKLDVYMWEHLPASDKKALRKEMNSSERSRYH